MKFCETCGNALVVKELRDEKILFCRKCKKNIPLNSDIVFSNSFDGKDESEFPTTNVMCPQCDDMVKAFWTMQQTRGGDEAPTRFYECKICKHRWREYS
jgi:DNA-directed RNA polymerase subunit M/transcription elongation factor TFIIS